MRTSGQLYHHREPPDKEIKRATASVFVVAQAHRTSFFGKKCRRRHPAAHPTKKHAAPIRTTPMTDICIRSAAIQLSHAQPAAVVAVVRVLSGTRSNYRVDSTQPISTAIASDYATSTIHEAVAS